MIVGEKEVVIISDRHPSLQRSVPETFGAENHAYCYRHFKNFNTLFQGTTQEETRVKKLPFNGLIVLHMHIGMKIMMLIFMSYEPTMKL